MDFLDRLTELIELDLEDVEPFEDRPDEEVRMLVRDAIRSKGNSLRKKDPAEP